MIYFLFFSVFDYFKLILFFINMLHIAKQTCMMHGINYCIKKNHFVKIKVEEICIFAAI